MISMSSLWQDTGHNQYDGKKRDRKKSQDKKEKAMHFLKYL